jgi:hypothetical protein
MRLRRSCTLLHSWLRLVTLFNFHDPLLYPLSIWLTSTKAHSRLLWNTKNHLPKNNTNQEMHVMIQLTIFCLPFKACKCKFNFSTVLFFLRRYTIVLFTSRTNVHAHVYTHLYTVQDPSLSYPAHLNMQ